jgi:large subunit ribosomal protein L10
MAKELKRLITGEWKKEFTGVRDLVLVDASRLKGPETWALRGKLSDAKMHVLVLQNRLAKLAMGDSGLGAATDLLRGPTAVVWGGDGAADISRALAAWNKKGPKVAIKGGLIDGAPGTPADVNAWAGLPSRDELLSLILSDILAPATGVAGAFHASLSLVANLVAAHVEKMEKQEKEAPKDEAKAPDAPAAAPAAPAAPAAAPAAPAAAPAAGSAPSK